MEITRPAVTVLDIDGKTVLVWRSAWRCVRNRAIATLFLDLPADFVGSAADGIETGLLLGIAVSLDDDRVVAELTQNLEPILDDRPHPGL